ncbi:unnamed protein product [Strongylus vulgaris]|uniref:Uncharacterized protein n=1 Tax=Strongylus vulgaris TaxID=40348 RepID=A0A3P7IEF1_STRVU|nr:unnamed protein product [Strongylus vulgaris]
MQRCESIYKKLFRLLLGGECGGGHQRSRLYTVELHEEDVDLKAHLSETDILACCGDECGFG